MGKRTNTVLQSAFFALAGVLPADEAIQYMKDAAEHSYLKKGRDVVEKNWNAIDAGATAFVKIDVPESWANPTPDAEPAELTGRPDNRQAGQGGHGAGQPDERLQPAGLRLRADGRRHLPERRLRL